ncbi:MAG: putative porin, partial [Bacteroidota bacterium]
MNKTYPIQQAIYFGKTLWLLLLLGIFQPAVAQNPFSSIGNSRGGGSNFSNSDPEDFRDSGLTADTAYIFYLHPDDLRFKRVRKLDLNDFQHFNPANQGDYNRLFLSNLGGPSRALIYEPTIRRGFDLGFHQYDLYMKTEQQAQFFNAYRPYTDLYFTANTQENNWIAATFASNVTPQANFAIDYRRITQRGFYQSQRVRHGNVGITTWFRTNGDRYLGFFSFHNNSIKNQNNGGITADSLLFEAQFRNNVSLIPVNINETAQTEFDHNEISYTQYFNFRKNEKARLGTDTLDFPGPPPVDTFSGPPVIREPSVSGPPPSTSGPPKTTSGPPNTSRQPSVPYVERNMQGIGTQSGLQHQILYRTQQYKFFDDSPDADSSFYGVYQTSQQGIRNFIRVRTLENNFSLPFTFGASTTGEPTFLLRPFLRYSLHFVNQELIDFQVNNLFVGGDLSINTPNEFLDLRVHAETGLADNAGDFLIQSQLGLELPKIGYFEAKLNSQSYRPNQVQQQFFISQISIWETNFQKTNELNLDATIIFPKWKSKVSASYHLIDNLIYFGPDQLPTQATEAVSVLQLKWQQRATFWKMGFESSMAFQVVDRDFLRLPEFWARSGLYFTGKIFGTMQTRLGGDLTFTSRYQGDGYFSAAGQFFQQNATTLPALPIFEAYFSAQVKNFRVLIKAVNLSDLMFEEAYFAAPNYPYPGYHIRFAIGWR